MANKSWFLDAPARRLGDRMVGTSSPVYITGEIGINHNGDLANAMALIDQAADAGCDAVKFQKRTPEICTPRDQWEIQRDTRWGRMSYIDYRHRVAQGLARLVRDVRVISEAMGDGVKRIYDSERAAMKKLRRIPGELVDHVDLAAAS